MAQKANEAIKWKMVLVYTLVIALIYAVFQGVRQSMWAQQVSANSLSVTLLSFVSCFVPIFILGMVFLYVFNRLGDFETTDS